ncbi:MAG TPA: hypothetical protein VFZ61_15040, partial [Polyangiales bacterium]
MSAVRLSTLWSSLPLWVALHGCSVVPPNDGDAGGGANRTPGEPFVSNLCFQCTLRNCNVPLRA